MSARKLFAIAAIAAACGLTSLEAHANAPAIEAGVSGTQLAQGEALVLRIRLRGAASASQPDLAPLAGDFEVLDVQRSQRTFVRNGVSDESVDWRVELLPRRVGEIEIPALAVGDAATEPLRIDVSASAAAPSTSGASEGDAGGGEPADAEAADAAPVLLEVHADRTQPYEHERVLLRVELYASAEVTDGALSAPEIPGTLIEPIGEDRRIEKIIGGRRHHGIERAYTILPEASGDFEIPPIRFEGRVRVPRPAARARGPRGAFGQAFFDDFFAQDPLGEDLLAGFFGVGSRAIVVESDPIALRVQPRPAAAAGAWWLPAREVALSELWDPAAGPVRVGEPLTRRIELRADGASPAQLPQLPAHEVAGLKQYAEAPKASENARGALRVDQSTLIPTQPGSFVLPAIEVAWWDTRADAARTAVLPARTVEVLPAAGADEAPASAGATDAATAAAEEAPTASPAAAATSEVASAATPEVASFAARRFAAVLALALAAASLLGVMMAKRRRASAPGAGVRAPLTPHAATRALRRACAKNDPAAAEAALRALGRALAPGAEAWQGMRWAETLGSPGLLQEIARLQTLRYLSQGETWEGAGLWQAWRKARKARRPARTQPRLAPLYPAQDPPRG